MPSSASSVGAVSFPIPEGVQDTALDDPVAIVLLAYLAHWLNFGLDPKLGNMRPTNVAAGLSAVPRDHRYPFDPGTAFVRLGFPALYCWPGNEATEQHTIVKRLRRAEYHVRWYFLPLTMPAGRGLRSGLTTHAARIMHRAADAMRHDTFPSADDVLPITMAPCQSVEQALCAHSIKLLRLAHGVTWESPGDTNTGEAITVRGMGRDSDGAVQRGFPTLHTVWQVNEFVTGDQVDDVVDETPDITLSIAASDGEAHTTIPMMDRNLNAPDGTDDPDQKP